MANSRIARFVMEVAPPQFVTVMRRRRANKRLDTIKEEDKDVSGIDSLTFNSKNNFSSSSSSSSPSSSSSSSSSSSASTAMTADAKYYLQGIPRSYSIFEN